ncbi:ferritin [Clostridium hydrogeniformans]|uniref:ferritin n=1 Tax=Clostridium hydrogeniformans TaxID=349933 RepID=UPI00047F64E4|nr:ferritin [Clostridium hydrogeniformans]
MLSDKLLKALNDQLNFEFFSSYTYLAMASYADGQDFGGFANFFRVQAQEELFHAMKIYDYITQKGGEVSLDSIEKPVANYESVVDLFSHGYDHEMAVTKRIYKLADLANEEREHATISLLKWFIDEQVEEENTFNTILKRLKRVDGNPTGLYMLDDELATRTFTPPAAQ